MPVRRVLADARVEADRGRVAVERGPVVYCAEGADHGGSVMDVFLRDGAPLPEPRYEAGLLGGVVALHGEAECMTGRGEGGAPLIARKALTMVPYFAWAQRAPGPMVVWLPRTVELAEVPPPATLATGAVPISIATEPTSRGHGRGLGGHRERPHALRLRGPARAEALVVGPPRHPGLGVGAAGLAHRVHCRRDGGVLDEDDSSWRPVELAEGSEFGIARDTFNRIDFQPVNAVSVRAVVQLQPGFSGGILQWRHAVNWIGSNFDSADAAAESLAEERATSSLRAILLFFSVLLRGSTDSRRACAAGSSLAGAGTSPPVCRTDCFACAVAFFGERAPKEPAQTPSSARSAQSRQLALPAVPPTPRTFLGPNAALVKKSWQEVKARGRTDALRRLQAHRQHRLQEPRARPELAATA
ncbi:unnamed protein product [Prorocentrum cordatum]|uniref:Non-reducing end beta-L-arabinofuranosidase-like GH127 C-terminal domain-containing protein n=1 Tax=Prorocentrum cordatum TaxID=2364126 RepID=A0ABN9V3J3_9DINO|nr:unnamed protein product [Polarella glacialis]